MEVYFWQNIVSPHQVPYIRAFAQLGHTVRYICSEAMTQDRRELGWEKPDLGDIELLTASSSKTAALFLEESSRDTIHILAGARADKLGKVVMKDCVHNQRRMGMITESPDPRGFAGLARKWKYLLERRKIGRHINFLLAMGDVGVQWFRDCGYTEEQLFPFIYVTERLPHTQRIDSSTKFEIVFAGRLLDLKGVDLLITAIRDIDDVVVRIVGDGPERNKLMQLSERLKVANKIEWIGQKSNAETQAFIKSADLLVLPSRKDGWGAVVNEAFAEGTPVICSSACGAATIVCDPSLGTVFPKDNPAVLKAKIIERVSKGKITNSERSRIQSFAKLIDGNHVASYLESVLMHVYEDAPKPKPPWTLRDSP